VRLGTDHGFGSARTRSPTSLSYQCRAHASSGGSLRRPRSPEALLRRGPLEPHLKVKVMLLVR
jgi:hypothetical protein